MRASAIVCVVLVACGGGESKSSGRRLRVVYDLDVDRAIDDRAGAIRDDLQTALADARLAATVRASAASLVVTPGDGADLDAIDRLVRASYADVIERRGCDATAGPAAICLRISAAHTAAIRKAALASAVDTVRARLVASNVADPTVVENGGQIVVEFPEGDPRGLAMRSMISRAGRLELKVVDDGSRYMESVFARVGIGDRGEATDRRAREDEIAAQADAWHADDGTYHIEYYLIAHDREASLPVDQARRLEQLGAAIACRPGGDTGQVRCTLSGRFVLEMYFEELAKRDAMFQVPDDRQIGFELVQPDNHAKDRRPLWRSVYLERTVRLTGAAIANATPSVDPNTNRPVVLVDFNLTGTRVLADLTAQVVGKKLAIILDDRIASAAIITGAIRGGRVSITMDRGDARREQAERDELVAVLKSGALAGSLRASSSTVVP
jgi:preprotein translocase subunit SecD